jgi:dihydrofolate synthase/folylpolyglutamate synthase
MAFDLFARKKLDYAIVEVGLGGRLDATNLSEPQVSVITRIGLDHVKVLGGTLRKIAREKAGIMRRGKPVVVGIQEPQAFAELSSRADAVQAILSPAESNADISGATPTQTGIAFEASGELGSGRFVLPLLGRHQVENCRTVLTVLGLLAKSDPRITMGGIRKGLRRVSIPARCQIVRRRPLTIVDSCHNPDSGRALARVIADYVKRRVILVYGSLGGKLVLKTVRPLAPWVEAAVLVKPDSPRAMPLPQLKRIFTGLGIRHISASSVPRVLSLARQSSIVTRHSPLPIVVAGSFYLAGEALMPLRRGTARDIT